jgi:hypothetical protein
VVFNKSVKVSRCLLLLTSIRSVQFDVSQTNSIVVGIDNLFRRVKSGLTKENNKKEILLNLLKSEYSFHLK